LLTGLLLTVGACSPNCNSKPVSLIASSPASAPTPLAQPTSPAISGLPLHEGEVGIGYAAATLGATGGKTPYQWSISGGAIPPGLSLSPDGNVSGTPTSPGVFNFTVQVAEAAGGTTTSSSTVTIRAALAAGLLPACAQYCSVEQGCANACGNFGTLSGGAPPFTYSLVPGGFVPAGVSVSGLSLAGTFTALAKYWQFTVNVTDALGATASISPTFYVFPHISLAGGAIPTSSANVCSWLGAPSSTGCTARFPYSGGAGTPTFTITSFTYSPPCPVPPGTCQAPPTPNVSVGGGYVTVSVPHRIGTTSGYNGTLTIVLTDQSPCAPGPVNCSSAPATITITQQGG
jgi:hypothetical protein